MTEQPQPAARDRFLSRALEIWWKLLVTLGLAGTILVVVRARSDPLLLVLGIVSLAGGLFLVAMLLVPVSRLDDRRLDRLQQEPDLETLLQFIHAVSFHKQWARARDILASLGPTAAPRLMSLLSPESRFEIRNPVGRRFLVEPSSNLRAAAASCLGKMGVNAALPQLLSLAHEKEKDPVVRGYAVEALGYFDVPEALHELRRISIADSNPDVKAAAQEALRRFQL